MSQQSRDGSTANQPEACSSYVDYNNTRSGPPYSKNTIGINETLSASPDSDTDEPQKKKCKLADCLNLRCPDIDNCTVLKSQLEEERRLVETYQQMVKLNQVLSAIFITLLKSVETPDGPKLSALKPDGGETKKAMLDLFNALLIKFGKPSCPGALGERIYNDLLKDLILGLHGEQLQTDP